MHTSLCLVMLALCLVALECTITGNTEEVGSVNNVGSEVGVTKTTTTAAQTPPVGDPLTVQSDKAPTEAIVINEPEDEEAEVTEEEDLTDGAQKAPEAPPPAALTTTNATANKGNTDGPQIIRDDAHSSLPQGQNPSHTPPTGRESGTPDHSLTASGHQVQNSKLQEVKTTTTSVPVPPPQLSLKANEKKGDDKSPTEHQAELEGHAAAHTKNSGSTDPKGPANKESQTITQPKQEGEDHSNGERQATIQGGVNAQQVAAAPITTTTTANKPSSKESVTTTGDVLAPALQGQGSSKTSTGVQNPVTPMKPADPTEGKKQIGAKTTTATTSTTTKPATVNKESGAALTTATITTDKQTASAETSTTSTVAPTTTLPKGFKIPQALEKMDSSSSTSLLIAFATIVTFTVTAVAPVY